MYIKKGKTMRKLFNMVALVMMTGFVFAQGSVSGTVTDSGGNALYGANVVVEGTSSGAATAADGSYSVDGVASGSYTITASYIGYGSSSVSVNVDGAATANFSLSSSAIAGSEVSVLGSRFQRNADEQAVPVEVITELEIRATGLTETSQLLQALVPSYNAPRSYITDGSDHMRPATLRGMAPGHVLVLVNGKRRHSGALVHVNGSVGRGSTQVDLNAIPSSAIAKIEVLRDGAAAKYGSDAIAGVINIILKETGGADVSVTYGQSYSFFERGYGSDEALIAGQDESTYGWDSDPGHNGSGYLPFTGDRGWARSGMQTVKKTDGKNLILHAGSGLSMFGGNLYISGQIREGGRTNRTGLDPRMQYFGTDASGQLTKSASATVTPDPREASFDRENHRIGRGEFEQVSMMWNGSFPMERGTFYTFGGFNTRNGESGCYYRRAQDNRTLRAWYPDGFLPLISPELTDSSFAAGMKGLIGDYAYDVSVTTGGNDFAWGMQDSHNATYGTSDGQQSDFDLGTLGYKQTSLNADFTTVVDMEGFAGPVNLAFGLELRTENYTIEAGEEAGYADGGFDVLDGPSAGSGAAVGCQCLPGLAPANEGDRDRDALSVYVDAEADVLDNLMVGVAIRAEDYSDFGNTVNGKIAMRYELQENVALRASVSTGFRAPALQEAYFSSIATNFIDGIPYEVGTFPVDTEPARALGAKDLDAETSSNLSAGLTFKNDMASLAVDAYKITVEDRIGLTETFKGSGMVQFFQERNIAAAAGRWFFNGVDTETNGLDIVSTLNFDIPNGKLLLKSAMNFTDTEVTNKGELETPSNLADYTSQVLLGRANTVRYENSGPDHVFQFSAMVQKPTCNYMVKLNNWGEVTIPSGTEEREQVLSSKWTVDAEYSFQVSSQTRLSLGVNNAFDEYSDKTIKRNSFNGIFQHSGYSPFGFNGRYIYARVDMSL